MTGPDIKGGEAPQLRLPFPALIGSFDDLAITDANRKAFETIRRWEDWHASTLCLIGPVQSGLGIAANLWAQEAGANLVKATDFDGLSVGEIESLGEQNCALDLADSVKNEVHLLMLLNLVQSKSKRLLLTARTGGATWTCRSADLRSRLDTLPIAEVYPPDEEMVKARLLASSKRRYIKLNKAMIDYLAIRLPRSYEAIEDYVERLDEAIDETGRAPSVHLARSVLEDGVSTRKLFDDKQDER